MNHYKVIPIFAIIIIGILIFNNLELPNFNSSKTSNEYGGVDPELKLLANLNKQINFLANDINGLRNNLGLPQVQWQNNVNQTNQSFNAINKNIVLLTSHGFGYPWNYLTCDDVYCGTSTKLVGTTLAKNLFSLSRGLKMKIRPNGNPLIGFRYDFTFTGQPTTQIIALEYCLDKSCISRQTSYSIATKKDIGDFDLEIGSDDIPVLVYTYERDNPSSTSTPQKLHGLHFGKCNEFFPNFCSFKETSMLDPGSLNQFGSIAMEIGNDEKPIIFYVKNNTIYVAHCDNLDCTIHNTYNIPSLSQFVVDPQYPIQSASIPGVYPVFTFIRSVSSVEQLVLAICNNDFCDSVSTKILKIYPQNHAGAKFHSVALDKNGNPGVAFYEHTPQGAVLTFSKCFDRQCTNLGKSIIDILHDKPGDPGFGQLIFNIENKPTFIYNQKWFLGNNNPETFLKFAQCENDSCNQLPRYEAKIIYNTLIGPSSLPVGDYLSITEIES